MLDKSSTIVKCTMVKVQYLRHMFLFKKWYKIRRILVRDILVHTGDQTTYLPIQNAIQNPVWMSIASIHILCKTKNK